MNSGPQMLLLLILEKMPVQCVKELTRVVGEKREEKQEPQKEEKLANHELPITSSGFWFLDSAIQDLFPKLLRLDGKELIVPTGMDIEVPQLSKQTSTETEPIKNQILQFLKEYYFFYDNGERFRLLDAYHDKACFSLIVSSNFNDPDLSNLEEYLKHSRDIKKIQDSYMRMQLLKHTKHIIVDYLSLLPKTQHDLCSFLVDLCFHTETMLCFSVNGLFKEVEGKCQGCVRAFTRIFITTHYNNSRICITNDELIVRNVSPREIQNAFIPANSPLSEEQQEMVKSFSMQSRMKLAWAQKCLEDNGWDYAKAAEIFTMLQNESKIPKEFFE